MAPAKTRALALALLAGSAAPAAAAAPSMAATPSTVVTADGSLAQAQQPAVPAASSATPTPAAPEAPGLDTPAPGGDAAPGVAPDTAEGLDPRDAQRWRPPGKPWRVIGEGQYRSLLVTDEDPANDRYLLYRLQGSYYPLSWLSVFARVGLFQRFVAAEDESGFRLEDAVLGATAEQPVSLAPWGWRRTLLLAHSLRVYVPTSFASAQQDLYFAAEGSTRAQVRIWDELVAGVRGTLHYRFHEYAEQAGPGGGTLPRLVVSARPFVEYSPLRSERWGTLTLGADLYGDETLDYPSRDPATLSAAALPPGTLEASTINGANSSDSFVTPHYGYDLYAVYTVPNQHFSVALSLEQNGNVVRYGEPRLYFVHRDQTELALQVSANY